MHRSPALRLLAVCLVFFLPPHLLGQAEDPPPLDDLTLTGPNGTRLRFTATDTVWRWTGLAIPATPTELKVVAAQSPIGVSGTEHRLAPGWTLVDQGADRLTFEQEVPAAGVVFRRIFSFGPAASVARIDTWARSTDGEKTLTRASLLDLRVDGEVFRETGAAPASFPLFSAALFLGIEHVSGTCRVEDDVARLWQTPHLPLGETWQFVATAVVGWALPSDCSLITADTRIRRAFYDYLDTVRLKPAGLELHTNTWWTLPLPFSETDVLRDIAALRQGFAERTGLFFDSFALDLGWSNPRSIWQVDPQRFPRELRPITDSLAAVGSKLGLWVSPGSAYPEGLDNLWLASAGYETTPLDHGNHPLSRVACFALGGRYQREFKNNLVRLARDYQLRHVKLDYMLHSCDVAAHGHPVGSDSAHAIAAGLADVLDSLRAVNPDMALEPLCTGYPPSPWWTTKTPYVLGPYGDDVPYGRVPSPAWMESLITARDIAYRQDRDQWLMPSQAIETIDIVRQSPGDFENLAVMAIGRGRWFISTYLKPELMTPQNWDFFAALVRWARANQKFLANAELFGGKPEKREAYGYQFHHPERDIYCARNPWLEERSITLPTCAAVTEVRDLHMIYPRREFVARLVPGADAPVISLAAYETLVLETVPAAETEPLAPGRLALTDLAPPAAPATSIDHSDDEQSPSLLRYDWSGAVAVPTIANPELAILVEGPPSVARAFCRVLLNGRIGQITPTGSAGQFGAAAQPSPENWKWFFVPVPPGSTHVQVSLEIPADSAAVGIYLRGLAPAPSAPAPATGPAFPLYRADHRAWTQALVPTTIMPPPEELANNGSP